MSVTFGCFDAPTENVPCWMCASEREWSKDPNAKCRSMCNGTLEESTAPEVNFSNMNAGNVLRLLGLHDAEGPWGSLSVEEIPAVLQRCMVVLGQDAQRAHLVSVPSEEGGERRMVVNDDGMSEIRTGCRVIHGGNRDADTVRRVTNVRDLLAWAHEHGHEVSWG